MFTVLKILSVLSVLFSPFFFFFSFSSCKKFDCQKIKKLSIQDFPRRKEDEANNQVSCLTSKNI